MLNGIDPILIFNFSKLLPDVQAAVAEIPVVSTIVDKIGLPPIPIYLSEKLTGIMIASEEKTIEVETNTETLATGEDPQTAQKALGATISVNMVGNKDSIGLTLISALCDLAIPKLTSKEYDITYLHGSVTLFRGLLHSFKVTPAPGDTRLFITLELIRTDNRTKPKVATPQVDGVSEPAANLGDGSTTPTGATQPETGGPGPQPSPPTTQPPVSFGAQG